MKTPDSNKGNEVQFFNIKDHPELQAAIAEAKEKRELERAKPGHEEKLLAMLKEQKRGVAEALKVVRQMIDRTDSDLVNKTVSSIPGLNFRDVDAEENYVRTDLPVVKKIKKQTDQDGNIPGPKSKSIN